MQFATVVAAFAAAGGLIFSAWTGYYSVEVARDQLDQSREDADRELRQQAVLVSTWTQWTSDSSTPRGEPGEMTGFITNRSLDPVDQVVVGVAAGVGGDRPNQDPARSKGPKVLLGLGPLPPCSRVVIPAKAVRDALGRGTPVDVSYKIAGVSFVDVYGQRWARLSSGPLQPLKEVSARSKHPSWDNAQSTSKVLLGGKNLDTVWAFPGSNISGLDAPKSLKDCGAEK
ncbi:hypothetical protein [Streptomyces sp. NPDC001657]|uniref:hypothetical protein n=1 Tax=Streptomyces sp. NPDC001657 TaxID=3154522 RepID=UPI00333305C1